MNKLTRRKFLTVSGISAASAVMAACSPDVTTNSQTNVSPSVASQPTKLSTSESTTKPTTVQVTAASTPAASLSVSPDLARIVLNRLKFGPRPEDWQRFTDLGQDDDQRLAVYLQEQLYPEKLEDNDLVTRITKAGFKTLAKPMTLLYEDHIVNNPYDDNDDKHWQWFNLPADETVEATFLRAVYSQKQLQEVLVDFWHNHFNVYGWHEELAPLFASYDRDVIRTHLFGNFRQFLEAVASHPSMQYYLDNRSNSDAGPNENYARELLELHTLGADHYLGVMEPGEVPLDENGIAKGYVDNDVYEAARCFTGWRVDDNLWDDGSEVGKTGEFLYYRPWHDRFNKIILGKYIPADQPDKADGRMLLDLLAAHPGTAAYVCKKLCQRLISDTPPQTVVARAAEVFLEKKDAPDQLRQVYQAILSSAEFKQTWGAKIKRPFEQAAAMLRGLNADFVRMPGGAAWTYQMMGQPLFGHHPPDGYADRATFWANTMATLYGWNLTVGIVENWWNQEEEGRSVLVDVAAQTPPDIRNAASLAEYWEKRLLGCLLPAESNKAIVGFMAGEHTPSDLLDEEEFSSRLPGMVELILMTPEFRTR
jgi:uncharacterized protein (DUF1800 family)